MTTNHYANGFVPNWRNRHPPARCFFPLGCATCLGKQRARAVYAAKFCAPVTQEALDVATTVLDRLQLLAPPADETLSDKMEQLNLQPKKLTWEQMQKKLKRERKKARAASGKASANKPTKKKKRKKKK